MLRFAREVIALRKSRPELQEGRIELLDAPEGVLAFARCHGDSRITCVFNMDNVPREMSSVGGTRSVIGQHATITGRTVRLGVSGFCLLQD